MSDGDPDAATAARARDDARWLARQRRRVALTVLLAAVPPTVATLAGAPRIHAVLAPLLIGTVAGLTAAVGAWSVPRGAMTMLGLWLALGGVAARLPVLADGMAALLQTHLLGAAAIALSVLGAAWNAAEEG